MRVMKTQLNKNERIGAIVWLENQTRYVVADYFQYATDDKYWRLCGGLNGDTPNWVERYDSPRTLIDKMKLIAPLKDWAFEE